MYLMAWKTDFSFSTYGSFLYKRFLRIAPAFYASLLVYATIIKYQDPSFLFGYNIFFHCLFLNNVITGNVISAPFWSIGTEWHFYMVLPAVIFLAKKFPLVKSVVILSVCCIIFSLLVYSGLLSFDWWEKQILVRFPEFAAGIIAGYYFKKKSQLPRLLSGLGGIALFLLLIFGGRLMKFTPIVDKSGDLGFILLTIALPFMTVAFAFLMFHTITQPSLLSKFLSGKIITYLGRISYSIYLWHSLAIICLTNYLSKMNGRLYNVSIGFFLVSLLTVIMASISYKVFESFYFKGRK